MKSSNAVVDGIPSCTHARIKIPYTSPATKVTQNVYKMGSQQPQHLMT